MRYNRKTIISTLSVKKNEIWDQVDEIEKKLNRPEGERLFEELRQAYRDLVDRAEEIFTEDAKSLNISRMYGLGYRIEALEEAHAAIRRLEHGSYEGSRYITRLQSEKDTKVAEMKKIEQTQAVLSSSPDEEVNTTELERLGVYRLLNL